MPAGDGGRDELSRQVYGLLGLPVDAVAVPALVSSPKEVDQLLAQLELHYLSNPDPSLVFVLLADSAEPLGMG